MNQTRRDRNMAQCEGWSFYFDEASRYLNRWVIVAGEAVTLSGEIVNDGLKIGTVYVRVQFSRSHLASISYQDGSSLFDSHRDLNQGGRSSLRIVDIEPGGRMPWSVDWVTPRDTKPGHFDFQVEVWNPPKLFGTPGEYMFHRTESFGGFEVLDSGIIDNGLLTFISYSHDGIEHSQWTMRLVEELMRHGIPCVLDNKDAAIGTAFDTYMSEGITTSPTILLICSDRYVAKANAYEGGVGFEMTRIEALLKNSSQNIRIVPIVRNNLHQSLPKAVRNLKGVDMRNDNWRGEPLRGLVRALKKREVVPRRNEEKAPAGIFGWLGRVARRRGGAR